MSSTGERMMGRGECPSCGQMVQRRRDFALRKHPGCDYVDDPSEAFHFALLDAALILSPAATAANPEPGGVNVFIARDGRTYADLDALAPTEPAMRLGDSAR
ncbi:hypothetical protein [Gordonia hongkongensis]|uniref:hypothetical protein n=1 Tax=Gordonia hongkongensis TaxID=1701090 RepID=UPI003D717EE9